MIPSGLWANGGDRPSNVLFGAHAQLASDVTPVLSQVAGDDPGTTNVLGTLYAAAPECFLGEWRERIGVTPRNLGLVAVGTCRRSTAAASGGAAGPGPGPVTTVEERSDLDAVIRSIGEYLDSWRSDGSRTVVYFDALDALFDAVDLRSAVDFLDDLTTRIADAGASGVFYAPVGSHAFAASKPQFQASVELAAGDEAPVDGERESAPDTDAILESICHPHRRTVLEYLLRTEGPVPVDDLAERLARRGFHGDATERRPDEGNAPGSEAGWSATGEAANPEADPVRRAYVNLYQVHLPKLDGEGLVVFDTSEKTVELRERARRVRPYLALCLADS